MHCQPQEVGKRSQRLVQQRSHSNSQSNFFTARSTHDPGKRSKSVRFNLPTQRNHLLPTQRNHLAACAIDGKIHVVGGRLQVGFTSAMTNILEVFDPATTNWTTRTPMPTTRGGINGIAANGYFFVFGGEGPSGVFDEMEMYVPAQNRW